jgi:hypothetical protein
MRSLLRPPRLEHLLGWQKSDYDRQLISLAPRLRQRLPAVEYVAAVFSFGHLVPSALTQ